MYYMLKGLKGLLGFLVCAILMKHTKSTLELNVHSINVLQNGLIGEKIIIELFFDDGFVSLDELKVGNLCFLVDGKECHCFDDTYGSVAPTLPASCVAQNWDYLWFSVQVILHDDSSTILASLPVLVENNNKIPSAIPMQPHLALANRAHLLTLVLPLTVDDLSRAAVLFLSLHKIPIETVNELLVFVPDNQHSTINHAILGMTMNCNFTTTVYPESVLFSRPANTLSGAFPYALQMGVKLLAAKLIKTYFYVTLDADVVLLHPFDVSDFIVRSSADNISRAVYHNEDRAVHAHWWLGSQTFLNFTSSSNNNDNGFGVTPSVLSTYGSLLVVNCIYHANNQRVSAVAHRQNLQSQSDTVTMSGTKEDHTTPDAHEDQLRITIAEGLWLDGFGRSGSVWSEYTLYRLVLDHYQIFDGLHVDQLSGDLLSKRRLLHCGDVWYTEQLPWVMSQETSDTCWFSVVQSSTGVSPGSVLKELMRQEVES